SERWVRKLVARLKKEGDRGILHRLRGRASKRKLGEAVRAKVVRLVKREYADFGPTLAAEYLAEKHGVVVSKESVRQILMEAGVWKRKRWRQAGRTRWPKPTLIWNRSFYPYGIVAVRRRRRMPPTRTDRCGRSTT